MAGITQQAMTQIQLAELIVVMVRPAITLAPYKRTRSNIIHTRSTAGPVLMQMLLVWLMAPESIWAWVPGAAVRAKVIGGNILVTILRIMNISAVMGPKAIILLAKPGR